MATIVTLICKECGKVFTMKKGTEKLFCSKECKSIDMKRKYDAYVEKECGCCGKMFKSLKKEKKKFCSYKCAGQNKKNVSREIKTCLACGTTFSERIKRVKNFCSEKCIKEWQVRPENIKRRVEITRESVFKKYGVYCVLMVDEFKAKALTKTKETYNLRGDEIIKGIQKNLKIYRNKKLTKRFSEKGYTILEFKDDNIIVQHPDGHIFENNRKLLVNRLNHDVELSTTIQPIGSPRTTTERKICKMLDLNNINYSPNNRQIIKGELDIYIPEYNLAIETNGLHWHSENYLNNDYHLIKTEKCDKLNIQLLHFFEDELLKKYSIVESMIKEKLNLDNNEISVEECIVKEVESKLSKEFLDINHIQGNVYSGVKLGLFYNNELVSLMTFSKLRNIMGSRSRNNNEYELLRFCNKLNTKIIGASIKIYDYFKIYYKPSTVIGYANRRYSKGELYVGLNFDFEKYTPPTYWYIVGKERKHKLLYKKDILVSEGYDITKSEHEIMLERKIARIYDCGNIKYIDKLV